MIVYYSVYERLNEEDQASAAYAEFINEAECGVFVSIMKYIKLVHLISDLCIQGAVGQDHLANAYKYLANYYLRHGKLDEALMTARKCTEFTETREEGKALQREISHRRAAGNGESTPVENPMPGSAEPSAPRRLRPFSRFREDDTSANYSLSPGPLTFTP